LPNLCDTPHLPVLNCGSSGYTGRLSCLFACIKSTILIALVVDLEHILTAITFSVVLS